MTGSTALSPEQFSVLESLAGAGLGPIGTIAALDASGLFSDNELERFKSRFAQPNAEPGQPPPKEPLPNPPPKKKQNNNNGGNGGNENNWINRLIPSVIRGDMQNQRQSSTSGNPYEAPTTLNPIQAAAESGSPLLLIGLLAAVGAGAYFIFRKHPKQEPKK